MSKRLTSCLFVIACCLFFTRNLPARDVVLTRNGKALSVVFVAPGTLTWKGDDKPVDRWGRIAGLSPLQAQAEKQRRLQRDSVRDLVRYLSKMSGAKVEILEAAQSPDRRLPIYIGSAAQKVFGPVGISKAGKYGFRVVVSAKGIGLYGESEYGTSYAIYELLHRLGCRWFMPSALGECIPSSPTLKVAQMDKKLAPATEWRRMEPRTADKDFRRRNRMNGSMLQSQHALEGYLTREQRQAHPEWCLHINGKPHLQFLRWTRQDVANAIGDAIIARLDKKYQPSVSLSPGDYVVPTEDTEERKADPVPRVWEPAAHQWSVTDRLVLLANRVAERVGKKYPDVRFGLLAYVNYSMPPAKYNVHPNVVPVIAPIDFNRQHPMTWENHPNDHWLLNMVTGWGKMAPHMGYYAYGMNLAEITAPNPFITKWGTDIPIILRNHCTYWMPETMGGWESMMPGFYLSTRMTFYPDEKPDQILDDLYTRFYGAAAKPMKQYWTHIDRCWIESNEYAGGPFGYLKMFTPERMARAREFINQALAQCKTITEYRRVKLIDYSLSNFELFMQMREDWADAGWWKLFKLGDKLATWRASVRHLRREYKDQYCFDSGLAITYVNSYLGRAYEGASAHVKASSPLCASLTTWKYRFDKEKVAEKQGWTQVDFDDKDWPTTQVVRDTWSSLGHHNTMGRIVYRQNVGIRKAPRGKKIWLWLGSTDGTARVFVNGKPVKYIVERTDRKHKKRDVLEAFSGFCQPAKFDITDAVKPGKKNQITLLCERQWLNELGTGGLMGPVLITYFKK